MSKIFSINVQLNRPSTGVDVFLNESGVFNSENVISAVRQLSPLANNFENESDETVLGVSVSVTDQESGSTGSVSISASKADIKDFVAIMQAAFQVINSMEGQPDETTSTTTETTTPPPASEPYSGFDVDPTAPNPLTQDFVNEHKAFIRTNGTTGTMLFEGYNGVEFNNETDGYLPDDFYISRGLVPPGQTVKDTTTETTTEETTGTPIIPQGGDNEGEVD